MPPIDVKKPAHSSASVLYYAMIGDIIGAPYEFNIHNIYDPNFKPFVKPERFKKYKVEFTDDSILTAAIAHLVRTSDFKDEKTTIEDGIKIVKDFVRKYPSDSFPGDYGTMFKAWAMDPEIKTMEEWSGGKSKSFGNGSAMRACAIGWAFGTLEETLKAAEWEARISHSHPEGIKGAQAIAAAVYLARSGVEKKDIKAYIETKFGYDLDRTLDEHRHYNRYELKEQSEICQTTVPMALRVFLDSDNILDCAQKATSLGGDSDTISCIACNVAGAYFGMPKWLEQNTVVRLDDTLKAEAKAFQDFINEKNPVADQEELEKVLANARVESYVLQKYKENKAFVPANDATFADLLAKKEAVRIYYEEEKKIQASKDQNKEDKAIIFADNKDEIIEKLTETVKSANSFLDELDDIRSCPVKMEPREDNDNSADPKYNKRNAGVRNTFRTEVEVVEHEKFPKKIDVPDDKVKSALTEIYNKNLEPLRQKKILMEWYETNFANFMGKMAEDEANGKLPTTADGWYKVIESHINADDYNTKAFPNGFPEDLKSAITDLKNIKDDPINYDPIKLSSDALTKLQNCFDKIANTTRDKNPNVLNQLMIITRISNAVNHWRDTPAEEYELSTVENERNKLESKLAQYDSHILVGIKTKDYYNAVRDDLLKEESINARFEPDKQPDELKNALQAYKDGKAEEAVGELKKLSEQLNNSAKYDLNVELTKKAAYVDRLLEVMDKAVTAPDPQFDPSNEKHQAYDKLYKELTSQANFIKRRMEYIQAGSNMYNIANNAKEHIEKLIEVTGNAFMQNSDDPLNKYLEENACLETIAAYQQKLNTYMLSKTSPKGKSKSEIAAINAAKEEIKEFNDTVNGPSFAVGEMANVTFDAFKESLDLSQLTKVLKYEDGMIKAFEKAAPGIRKEAEAAAKAAAKEEAAHRKAEEAQRRKDEAAKAKANELNTAKRGLEETFEKFGSKEGMEKECGFDDYRLGLGLIEKSIKTYPKDTDIHASCKKALAALIKHANKFDKESPEKNIASGIRDLFKNKTPNAGKLFRELVSDSKKASAQREAAAKLTELDNDLMRVNDMHGTFSDAKYSYDFDQYKSCIETLDEMTKNYPDNLKMLKLCGDTANAILNHVAAHDAKKNDFSLSNAIADDEYSSKVIQDVIKKGSVAARQLKEAEKAKQQEEQKNEEAKPNESNLLGK